MTNMEKYRGIFADVLGMKEEDISSAAYKESEQWDSVGHLMLVSEIENVFDVVLDTDEIMEFSSFEDGIKLLEKYDIEF